ncbi:hypothetical protein RND81_03G143400 [Saponaria officinalis]|uniref:Uncharacterized protein n=1 Tax=Saponaria officinalis TaxID=3572 RepID=A0AAW1M7X7_SAPOF
MEQCGSFGWIYCNEDEGMMGDMRQYILQSRMELEATIYAAQEEIMRKEEELLHMKDLLMLTIKERDEAQSKLHNVMLENLLIQQQLQQQQKQEKQVQKTTKCFSSSSLDSEDSSIITSSPQPATTNGIVLQKPPQEPPTLPPQIVAKLSSSTHPLPEKGKLLKAVMEAGPLLQTLLLAGPLPQWQHPPPLIESIEIPLVTINTKSTSPRKRGIDTLDCPMISSPKYHRVV